MARQACYCVNLAIKGDVTLAIDNYHFNRLHVLIAYMESGILSFRAGGTKVSKGRILIAEDFLPAAFMVEEMARDLDFDADVVSNGREAVARAQANRYVAILMDVEMPVMDGIEATALIRKIEQTAGFQPNPIIGMTGHTSQGVRVLCQRAGMDSFLLKPFTITDLEAALDKVRVG